MKKIAKIFLFTGTIIMSAHTHATIIDNGTYTTDTVSGLDWLDLTETVARSYNDISAKLGSGSEFAGWSYATTAQVSAFFDANEGSGDYTSGWTVGNNGLFATIAPLWGDLEVLASPNPNDVTGEGYSSFIVSERVNPFAHITGRISNIFSFPSSVLSDYVNTSDGTWLDVNEGNEVLGSALVRPTVVPIPSAVLLMGFALLGMIRLKYKQTL